MENTLEKFTRYKKTYFNLVKHKKYKENTALSSLLVNIDMDYQAFQLDWHDKHLLNTIVISKNLKLFLTKQKLNIVLSPLQKIDDYGRFLILACLLVSLSIITFQKINLYMVAGILSCTYLLTGMVKYLQTIQELNDKIEHNSFKLGDPNHPTLRKEKKEAWLILDKNMYEACEKIHKFLDQQQQNIQLNLDGEVIKSPQDLLNMTEKDILRTKVHRKPPSTSSYRKNYSTVSAHQFIHKTTRSKRSRPNDKSSQKILRP